MLHSDSLIVTAKPSSFEKDASDATRSGDASVALFVDCWQGKAGRDRILLIVHGLGEHGGRYRHLADALGSEFERFYAMDLRGHGRSSGQRGHADSVDAMVEDVRRVIAEIEARERGKELFLLAHSFGGLIALRMLLKGDPVPFKGAIISSPFLGMAMKVSVAKQMMSEVFGRTLSRIHFSTGLKPSHISHDPEIVAAYVRDRLVHSKITPKLYLEFSKTIEWVQRQWGPLACPALFLVAGDDRIVDSGITREFVRGLKDTDKELCDYEGFYHEVLNEAGKEKVFEDIRKWLQARTNSPNSKKH